MNRIVCKFGGSSIADADRMRAVRAVIEEDPARQLIVLSAPGKRTPDDEKITDLLYRMIEGGHFRRSIFSRIFQRYAAIRDALTSDFDLEAEFDAIAAHDPADADYFVSRGEALCAKLFAAYTGWDYVDAAELLFFDERGGIDRPASAAACARKLTRVDRAVIPGFYGRSPSGGVRTFSRGGSDVSGAWIAALTHADRYENWTDVDGLFSADPNIVPEARRIPEIEYDQAEEILRAGAGVLHPDAIDPLRRRGIECEIRNALAPEKSGTRIRGFCGSDAACVTGRKDLFLPSEASIEDDGHSSRSPLLYPFPVEGGIPATVISVFGADEVKIQQIAEALKPLHTIHMREHASFIIPNGKYAESLRRAHEILFDADE